MGGFASWASLRARPWWIRAGAPVLAAGCLLVAVGCVPVSVAPPDIVGLPEVGQTLTASPGRWNGEPTAFTFTWRSCRASAAGDECVTRQQGPAPTYAVAWADRGRRLRVTVTGTNQDGSGSADSAPTAVVRDDADPSIAWQGWATSPDHARSLGELAVASEPSTAELTVDPAERHQTWLGAGGALTDSAVGLLDRAGPDLLRTLFDPDAAGGARLGLVRLPLSATDFSTRAWTWQDDPAAPVAAPPEAVDAIAALQQAAALRPDLQAVGASWSAPAWMKDSGRLNGGGLAPGMEDRYADLLVQQARLLRRSGVPLLAMSLGNEPGHSAADYPTMTMSDQQMIGLAGAVHDRLADKGVELWALDHNWSDRARADALLAGAPGAFDAVAFHCYSGQPSSMGELAVPVVMTECTGGDWDPSWASTFRWQARNLVVDPAANGSTGLLLWNLALDPTRGPHTGGCGNCRGIVTVDPATGSWTPEPEFFLLAQLGRAADPGAVRTGLRSSAGIAAVAFANPDGTIGIFGHNDTGRRQVVDVAFAAGDATRVAIEPGELFTLRGSPLEG
jgi:glucosylceramidase